jgi:broad specificity phosphatase PhoE
MPGIGAYDDMPGRRSTPDLTIFVRHGRTWANDLYGALRAKKAISANELNQLRTTRDRDIALGAFGVEQARLTATWLNENVRNVSEFDKHFMSPYMRTIQTAQELSPSVDWRQDIRLAEQDYGIFATMTPDEHEAVWPGFRDEVRSDPWNVCYPGGESFGDVVRRYSSFQENFLYDSGIEAALIVSHAGLINAARCHIERIEPSVYTKQDANGVDPVRNASVLIYSRLNPATGRRASGDILWRRLVHPAYPELATSSDWHQV